MSQKTLGSFGFCSRGLSQDATETNDIVGDNQSELAEGLESDDNTDEGATNSAELTATSNCTCPCCTKPESSHHCTRYDQDSICL